MKSIYTLRSALVPTAWVCALACMGQLNGQLPELQPDWWVANGTVADIEADASTDRAYVCGTFTQLEAPVPTKYGAALDRGEGWPLLTYVRPNTVVRAVAADGNGGWFIGGDFTSIAPANGGTNTTPKNRLAHILPNGDMDTAWTAGADAAVRALVVSNGILYVGGDFAFIGGAARNRVAAFDIATGTITPFNLGLTGDGDVNALEMGDGVLYAGGTFTVLGGQNRTRLAALDLTTGDAVANWSPTANNTITTIKRIGTQVYVGGSFTQITGNAKVRLAELDAATGALSAWNPAPNSTVYALAIADDTLFVGGDFSTIGGQSRDHIAAVQRSVLTNNAFAWNPDANNTVLALRVDGPLVYAGGSFTQAGNPVAARVRVAAFDRNSTSVTDWDPHANATVRALDLRNDAIYAGGDFTLIGMRPRNRMACIDVLTGHPTTWKADANNTVLDLLLKDSIVYAAGWFGTVNTVTNNRLAAVHKETGALIPGWAASVTGSWVHKLVESDGVLYAGGSFTSVSGYPRSRLVALNAVDGAVLPNWVADADDDIYPAMLVSGTRLYVGGDFQNIGVPAVPRSRIAALDKATGAVDLTWSPGANNRVYCLLEKNGKLFVGGHFTQIGGQPRGYLAALDPSTGTPDAFLANGNGFVYALYAGHDVLFAGGDFTVIQGQTRNRLAAIELGNGTVLPWDPQYSDHVQTIVHMGSENDAPSLLLTGGAFNVLDGASRSGLAVWEPDDEINVGIAPAAAAHGVHLYPNPTSDLLQVVSEVAPMERIMLINVAGMIVRDERPAATQRHMLDLANAANGFYSVRVFHADGISSLPVVVQH